LNERARAEHEAIRESPFIVGLLGHRELDPARVPRCRDTVAAFIAETLEHLPDTEVRAIIGLTQGSDLLYVRGAIDAVSHVEVVLPASLEECAGAFDAQALQALRDLLMHPNISSTVLSPPVQPLFIQRGEDDRHEVRYAHLTHTLVRRSSVLLTLWDAHSPLHGGIPNALRQVGVVPSGADGEAALVMLDLAGDVDAADSVVRWTPGARAAGNPQSSTTMPPQLVRHLVDLNTYNRDYRRLRTSGRIQAGSILLERVPAELAADDRPALAAIDAEYGKADALALRYQSRSDRLFTFFAVMAFTMGSAYLTYDKLAHLRSLLVSYLVVLLGSLCIYHVLRGRRWFAKHLNYRALAETLRVTFYLRLIDTDHRLDAARVLALSGINRFRGFSLIADVLAALAIPDAHAAERRAPDLSRSRYVEREWLQGQHHYFVTKVSQLKREDRRVNTLKNALFATVLLVIVAMVVSDRAMEQYEISPGVSLKTAVTVAWGFLALLLGAWQLHDNHKATRELLLQYRNQRIRFAHARHQLLRLADVNERNHILEDLGRSSLMESYLWTIHRYHREHEPVGKH
jgi:hypothetical protein